jgi:hypothetical protein
MGDRLKLIFYFKNRRKMECITQEIQIYPILPFGSSEWMLAVYINDMQYVIPFLSNVFNNSQLDECIKIVQHSRRKYVQYSSGFPLYVTIGGLYEDLGLIVKNYRTGYVIDENKKVN